MTTPFTRPSVASLFIELVSAGETISTATGFVVEHDGGVCLVTNRHVVTGRHQGTGEPLDSLARTPKLMRIHHNNALTWNAWISANESLYDTDGRPLWYEHIGFAPPADGEAGSGQQVDVIVLPLTKTDGYRFVPYDVSEAAERIPISVSESLSIVGFPFGLTAGGLFGVWVRGTVASEMYFDYGYAGFLIDSRTRPGQSGSPVIYYSHGGMTRTADGSISVNTGPVEQFVGIYSGRIHEDSDLGMVWKARVIREILTHGKRPQPDPDFFIGDADLKMLGWGSFG